MDIEKRVLGIALVLVTISFSNIFAQNGKKNGSKGLVPNIFLYVDTNNLKASDENDGSINAPLLTIQEAVDRAVSNKRNFTSTQVSIQAGIYREEVSMATYTNYPNNDPNNLTPIWFVGEGPGLVKITGADVWDTGWTQVDKLVWEHDWPYEWGVYPDPTGGGANVPTITRRREMVFLGDTQLRQVESGTLTEMDTFRIDEKKGVVQFLSSNGDPNNPNTLVGIREQLWKQEFEHNVTIKNIDFEYGATRWQDAVATVRIAGSNDVSIENSNFTWNNGRALYFTGNDGVSLTNVKMNDNGWDGWGTWKVKNFTGINTETSRNNWRGHWGEYYRWSVGNKILRTHGFSLVNHVAKDNYARGLWLDLDNINVEIDGLLLEGNLRDGAFIEANQGPIHITKARVCDNNEYGLYVANTDSLTITNSTICNNELGEIMITGQNSGRWVYDFETSEEYWVHSLNWKFDNVKFTAKEGKSNDLIATTLIDFDPFLESLESNFNTWCHPSKNEAIAVHRNISVDLTAFQDSTGQDLYSRWRCAENAKGGHKSLIDAREDPVSFLGDRIEDTQLSLSIYPNPSSERLNIFITKFEQGRQEVDIYDILGKKIIKVFDGTLEANEKKTIEVDLRQLPSGSYLVVSSGGEQTFKRLIQIQH